MENIKEICGYQDAKGRFFATKEALQATVEEERQYEVVRKQAEDILIKCSSFSYRMTPWDIEKLLKYLYENPTKFAQMYSDYTNTKLTISESMSNFARMSVVSPTGITAFSEPQPTKTKKKWYQLF